MTVRSLSEGDIYEFSLSRTDRRRNILEQVVYGRSKTLPSPTYPVIHILLLIDGREYVFRDLEFSHRKYVAVDGVVRFREDEVATCVVESW